MMWLVRFRMRSARPFARGIMRFMLGPSSAKIFVTFQIVNVSAIVVFSVSNGRFQKLLDQYSRFLVGVGQNIQSLRHFLTANQVSNKANLLSRRTTWRCLAIASSLPPTLFLLRFFISSVAAISWSSSTIHPVCDRPFRRLQIPERADDHMMDSDGQTNHVRKNR